jgi:hypothetical protein
MTLQQRPHSEALPTASPKPPGRNHWNWLALARIAWIVLALVLLVNFVASIPIAYQYMRIVCTLPNTAQCPYGQLTLARLHLSEAAGVDILIVLVVALSLLF